MSNLPPLSLTLRPLAALRTEYDARRVTQEVRTVWRSILRSKHWSKARSLFGSLDLRALMELSLSFEAHSNTVGCRFPQGFTPTPQQEAALAQLVELLIPWRVGPFSLGSLEIDTEWRSQQKWARISPLLPKVEGHRIADVGCSSGYFLFQLARIQPSLVVGLDPVDRCWLQVALLQSLIQAQNLSFLPLGLASLTAFPQFFDLILCMGVIYHQRDPFSAVRVLFESLRPGGILVLESLVIDAPGPHFLVPPERYAKMRNAWLIPTADALASLLSRAGFREITVHRFGPLSVDEQRRTPFAPYESLAEFLDPHDTTKTIEGFPAPHTAAVIGRK